METAILVASTFHATDMRASVFKVCTALLNVRASHSLSVLSIEAVANRFSSVGSHAIWEMLSECAFTDIVLVCIDRTIVVSIYSIKHTPKKVILS